MIVFLALANGVLAGAEIAVVSLRKSRLQELIESGNRAAIAVRHLRDNPERFLATVQVGITVIGATAGAFGGLALAQDLVPMLEGLPLVGAHARGLAFGMVVALVSYLSIVLGELVPKSLALRAADRYALLVGRPLSWLSSAARPVVWFLTASSNAVLRLFGDRTSFTESRLSPDELRLMLEEAAKAGSLDPHAGEIAARALEFGELTAAEVMVPRNQVVAIPRGAPHDEIRRLLLEHAHTRMPVYEGTIDRVVGYISIKDVLAMAWEEKLLVLEDLIRPPLFVPKTVRAVDLLQKMRQRRTPFAIVVDERGGMAGIVTMEDLLEELVGEIFSEHVRHIPELIRREPDGSATVLASVALRDVNRELGFDLPESTEWTTVAGLCLALSGRIPQTGEVLKTSNGFSLEILDASPRRVRRVRIRPPSGPPPVAEA